MLSLLFLSPSLRTLSSFQAAMIRLGGGSFVISPDMDLASSHARHRHERDGRRARPRGHSGHRLLRRRDRRARLRRAPRPRADLAERTFKAITRFAPSRGSTWSRRSTIRARRSRTGRRWTSSTCRRWPVRAVVGLSPARFAARGAGGGLAHGREARHERRRAATARLRVAAGDHGQGAPRGGRSRRQRHGDRRPRCAITGAHVVYAKEWSSTRHYGDKEADAQAREGSALVRRRAVVCRARPDCKLMHCLPVRRGVAVADRMLDGPRSVVIQEARNRLYAQMAVLYRMMKGLRNGDPPQRPDRRDHGAAQRRCRISGSTSTRSSCSRPAARCSSTLPARAR